MATQNFTCTAGTAKSENLTAADAAANDDVFCVIYEAGAAKITKRTSHYGGSSAEIEVDAGVKYILKLTAAETAYLATGATYTFKRIVGGTATELYSGTITVTGATTTVTTETLAQSVICRTQIFTANAKFTDDVPANSAVLGFKVLNETSTDGDIIFGTGDGSSDIYGNPTPLVVDGNTCQWLPMVAGTPIWTSGSDYEIWVGSADWTDLSVTVTVFYV